MLRKERLKDWECEAKQRKVKSLPESEVQRQSGRQIN